MSNWFSQLSSELHPRSSRQLLSRSAARPMQLSIGVVTYNRAPMLAQCLTSIIGQLTNDVEVVVVDDGSRDNTASYLAALNHPSIRIFTHEENRGRPWARNAVLEHARGEFIVWVDDDDLLQPNAVAYYLGSIARHGSADVLYGPLMSIDLETGEELETWSPRRATGLGGGIIANLLEGRGITFGGSLIRRSLYRQLGGFDTEFSRAQDHEFWYRAAGKARFVRLKQPVYVYRINRGGASFSRNIDTSFESLAIRKHLQTCSVRTMFPELLWSDAETALQVTAERLGMAFYRLGDYHNALRYLKRIAPGQIAGGALDAVFTCHGRRGEHFLNRGFLSSVRTANAGPGGAGQPITKTLQIWQEKSEAWSNWAEALSSEVELAERRRAIAGLRNELGPCFDRLHRAFKRAARPRIGRAPSALAVSLAKRLVQLRPDDVELFNEIAATIRDPGLIAELAGRQDRLMRFATQGQPLFRLDDLAGRAY